MRGGVKECLPYRGRFPVVSAVSSVVRIKSYSSACGSLGRARAADTRRVVDHENQWEVSATVTSFGVFTCRYLSVPRHMLQVRGLKTSYGLTVPHKLSTGIQPWPNVIHFLSRYPRSPVDPLNIQSEEWLLPLGGFGKKTSFSSVSWGSGALVCTTYQNSESANGLLHFYYIFCLFMVPMQTQIWKTTHSETAAAREVRSVSLK